jgi:hypothetical protein
MPGYEPYPIEGPRKVGYPGELHLKGCAHADVATGCVLDVDEEA